MENEITRSSTGALLSLIIGDSFAAFKVEQLLASKATLPTIEELTKIKGVGAMNARKVLACCELSARYIVGTEADSVLTPEDIVHKRLAHLKYEEQEHFVVITLDSANHVIGTHEITKGLMNQTPVHPREVFRQALKDNAASIIVAHNHPSGSTTPSEPDMAITRVLLAAGKVMQIPVIDHIIVSKSGFTSICREDPELFEKNVA